MAEMPPMPANPLEVPKFAFNDVHSPCFNDAHSPHSAKTSTISMSLASKHMWRCDMFALKPKHASMRQSFWQKCDNGLVRWKIKAQLDPQNAVQRVKKKGVKINPFFGGAKMSQGGILPLQKYRHEIAAPQTNDSKNNVGHQKMIPNNDYVSQYRKFTLHPAIIATGLNQCSWYRNLTNYSRSILLSIWYMI